MQQKNTVSGNDYELFFQNSFDHFMIVDHEGIILKVNNQWEQTLGYSPAEMEGEQFLRFLHPDDVVSSLNKLSELPEKKSDEGFVNRYRTKAGEFRFMEWKINIIGEKHFATARDITRRRMLENEAELRKQLIEKATDLLVTLSPEGFIESVNPAVTRLLGYSEEDFLKKHFTSFFLPKDAETQTQIFMRVLEEGVVYNHHNQVIRKDGSLAEFSWHLINLKVPGIVFAAGRDIEEEVLAKKALSESEERFRSLFENMNAGFALVEMIYDNAGNGVDFRFLEVNKANARLTLFSREQLEGSRILELNPHFDPEIIRLYAEVDKTGIPSEKEIYYPPTDLYYHIQAYSPRKGQVATIFENISYRVRANNLISEKNRQLEQMNAEKDKFFSIIAHDLRSPFQGFLGILEILDDETAQFSQDEIRERLSRLRNTGKKLYGLIDNLLIWASFQRGGMPVRKETLHLAEVTAKATGDVLHSAELKEITIRTDIPGGISVSADAMMYKTIIRNLLTNAVKFSYRGGSIFITAAESGGFAEITVRDEGKGISAADLPRLFAISEKVSTPGTENEPSSGLGLILCHEFAAANGGSVTAESTPGKGASFILRLPLAQG